MRDGGCEASEGAEVRQWGQARVVCGEGVGLASLGTVSLRKSCTRDEAVGSAF